jgi:hypothetical protein
MLDCAFGNLLGFLPGNFTIWMIFSAIAKCRGDDGINLVGIGQCESPGRYCLHGTGHDLAFRFFQWRRDMQAVSRRRPLRLYRPEKALSVLHRWLA